MKDDTADTIKVRWLGRQDYLTTLSAMEHFTNNRSDDTIDEIWLLEHHPVFTQGQVASTEHLLNTGDIKVVQSNRGGQVTYHGYGQLVAYFLLNLKHRKQGVRDLIHSLEQIVINTLTNFHIQSYARADAPGVYVNEHKICSLGLRFRHGYSFHGLALNVAMDLEPFSRINPCGYKSMVMTQISALNKNITSIKLVGNKLIEHTLLILQYNKMIKTDHLYEFTPLTLD